MRPLRTFAPRRDRLRVLYRVAPRGLRQDPTSKGVRGPPAGPRGPRRRARVRRVQWAQELSDRGPRGVRWPPERTPDPGVPAPDWPPWPPDRVGRQRDSAPKARATSRRARGAAQWRRGLPHGFSNGCSEQAPPRLRAALSPAVRDRALLSERARPLHRRPGHISEERRSPMPHGPGPWLRRIEALRYVGSWMAMQSRVVVRRQA